MVAPTVGINPLDPLWIATLVAIVTLSSAGVAGVGGYAQMPSDYSERMNIGIGLGDYQPDHGADG